MSTPRSRRSRFPAVLKPVDSGGQRAVFRIETREELERDLAEAIAESPTDEALLEEFVDGVELNGIVIARDGEPALDHALATACARPASASASAGSTSTRRRSRPSSCASPSRSPSSRCARSASRDAIAFPQLIASPDGSVAVVEVAARIPGGQMADLVRHAVGVDLVEVALLQALGEDVPDDVALPRFTQPLAIRFFTAEPGPLPTGRVTRIGEPRRRARVGGRRAGGHVPPDRRDDPSRPP